MFKNMKIGAKLLIVFMAVTIISSIAGVIGFVKLIQINASYSDALINYGFSQGDIGAYYAEFNFNRATLRDIVYQTNENDMNKSVQKLEASKLKCDELLVKIKKTMTSDDGMVLYNAIVDNMNEYRKVRDEVVQLGLANHATEAMALFNSEAVPYIDKIVVAIESLFELKVTMGNDLSSNMDTESQISLIIIGCIIVAAIGISLTIATVMSKSISRPVKQMADAAKRMSNGDLKVKINVTSNDEIGDLGNAFSDTISNLNMYISAIKYGLSEIAKGNLAVDSDVVFKGDFIELEKSLDNILSSLNITLSQINQSSEQVSSGSQQVSDGAQALSQGATEQASSIQELSATITEISNQVKSNASMASKASAKASSVGEEIVQSNQQMQSLISAMSDISDSSHQIGKIIKTIEDIAFQTNILALNAAVEAARAGSAGKGFAVVADEVRSLASKSAEAAKNTTALIEGSIIAVENGTKLADATAHSLISVVDGAKELTSDINSISDASNAQANSITQVTLGVEQISGVVQTNSATAEQSAAASEELNGQADLLKQLVSKFTLKSDTGINKSNNSDYYPQNNPTDDYSHSLQNLSGGYNSSDKY